MLPEPAEIVRFLPGLIVGITVHEFAHAFTATKLGDDLALSRGRVSLNPLRHLDPIGTLAILFLRFGWGRPVPVNIHKFRNPRRDFLLTSLAGPASNVVLALLILPLLYLTRHTLMFGAAAEARMDLVNDIARNAFVLNLVLATFNLLPVPPLDGSRILPFIIPNVTPEIERRLMLVGVAALVFLMWTGRLSAVFGVVVGPAMKLVPPTDRRVFHDHYCRGMNADALDRHDEALAAFDAALRLDPDAGEVLFRRGCVLGQQEKWPSALIDLDRAIALDAANPEYYEYRAWLHEKAGSPEEAQKDWEEAEGLRIRTRQGLAEAEHAAFLEHFQAGKAASQEGRYEQAVARLGQALRINPESDSTLYWRARALGGQEKWTEAQADIDRATQLNGGNRRYWKLQMELEGRASGLARALIDAGKPIRGEPTGERGCPARKDAAEVNEAISVKLPKVHMTGLALANVLQFLQDVSTVPIEVDWDALGQAGVTPRTPVMFKAIDRTVRDNLQLALQSASPHGDPITWAVVGGKIIIPARDVPPPSTQPAR